MSIVHVEVGRVTESLPRNDAYALIFVKLFFIKIFWARNFGPAAASPAAPAPTALGQGGPGPPWLIQTYTNLQQQTRTED